MTRWNVWGHSQPFTSCVLFCYFSGLQGIKMELLEPRCTWHCSPFCNIFIWCPQLSSMVASRLLCFGVDLQSFVMDGIIGLNYISLVSDASSFTLFRVEDSTRLKFHTCSLFKSCWRVIVSSSFVIFQCNMQSSAESLMWIWHRMISHWCKPQTAVGQALCLEVLNILQLQFYNCRVNVPLQCLDWLRDL